MSENAGFQPMGNKLAGQHAVRHAAVIRGGEVACPDHDGAEVTKSGSLYKCDHGHVLTAPIQSIQEHTTDQGQTGKFLG
jgi:hypothetical protein